MKRIYCQIEQCLGCKSCEIACAIEHSESKTLVGAIQEESMPNSRIHVEMIDDGGTAYHYRNIAVQCRHCDDSACVEACISGAIRKNDSVGDVEIDEEKCVGCWSCIMVCPFGAIVKNHHRAMKCDLCPDREIPACVEACSTHALVYCEREE